MRGHVHLPAGSASAPAAGGSTSPGGDRLPAKGGTRHRAMTRRSITIREFTSEVFIVKTLEDQIDDLEKLDKLRRRARQLQMEAIEALTAIEYEPSPRTVPPDRKKKSTRPNWEAPGDDVEKALLLRVLSTLEPKSEEGKQHEPRAKRRCTTI